MQRLMKDSEEVHASIAKIYQIHDNHRNAVDEYMKLVKPRDKDLKVI